MLRSLHLVIPPIHQCLLSRFPKTPPLTNLRRGVSLLRFSSPRRRACFRGFRMSSGDPELTTDAPAPAAAVINKPKVIFCQNCGNPTKQVIPEGDEKLRAVCTHCGRIHYENPKMINKPKVTFCQNCGNPTKQVIPEGDEKLRAVCTHCGRIHYENPKMVVGCLVEHNGKVLLCKRKIQPSYGLWTLPAGYLEIGESTAEGAARETLEEACALVEIISPFAQLDIPRIGQSYIIFLARLREPHFSPGIESLECTLFDLDDIPFDSLAFSSIYVTLKMYIEDIKSGKINYHYCTINKRLGASPSDPQGFDVENHLCA